jgi:NADPH-dependent 2,4-dienoyl-CoA reductase/sulfur reductase-like enzyme
MSITRRNFIKAAGATAALAAVPGLVRGATTLPAPKKVIVVGGGFAGSTVAKYIRLWSGGNVAVTLVDPSPSHVSCVLSNLVLNGRMQLSELTIAHSKLGPYGVEIVKGEVPAENGIDPLNRSVTLASGTTLTGDRLILAMGIGFGKVDGWTDQTKIPHAWIAGQQTTILRDQLRALPAGGTFVMTVPKAPYRCPPGPYERACLVADIMKRKGGGKVVVLDANSSIQAEAETFNRAFKGIYSGIVSYYQDVTLKSVSIDSAGMRTVKTTRGDFKGGVANILPPHQAPDSVMNSGLVPAGAFWAPVDPLTYESTLSPGVHVIGNSQGTAQPKSGHMANSQAKVCADAIVRLSQGFDPLADLDRTANVTTNSACYSPITYREASWLTANFRYDTDPKSTTYRNMKLVQLGEAAQWNSGNYEDMFQWASNLFTDSFA